MNKSTTNRNFSNQPDIGLVSRSELGKRVLVNGHFGGILRYLGPVQGKQGIFFGVELDQPVGKNDGTHQGTFYFQCRPGHGVFAPCHKIELEERGKNEREEMGANQLLSRSAMPSLAFASIPPAKNAVGQPAPMDWSLMSMSTGSTNSAGSLAKFLDEDLMAHSHATYTVFESDCLMLSDLELSDSAALLRFDEEGDEPNFGGIGEEEEWGQRNIGEMRQQRVDESMILEGPTFGGMDLPVIGTPDSLLVDDAPTPMAEENLDFATGLTHWQQQRRSLEDRQNRNNLGLSGLGQRNGGRGQGELFTAISSPCRDNSPNNNNGGGQRQVINGEERRRKGGNKDARNNNNNRAENGMTTNCTSPAGEEAVANGGKSREKRPRVSVFQSIPMPSQNLSAAARSKPKQPTKAQLVMEQLKASMEAEKQRPKKEIRSKLQVAREEMEEEKGKGQEEESAPTKQMKSQSNIDHSSSRAKKMAEDSKGAEKQQKSAIRNAQISSSTKPKSSVNSPLKRPYATKTSSSKSAPNVVAKSDAVRPSRQILTSKENTASSSSKQPTTSASGFLLHKMAKSSSNESVASKTSSKIAGFFNKPVTTKKKPKEPTKAEIKQILQKKIESFGLAANRVLSSHLAHHASVADSEIAKLRQLHGQSELENAEKLEQQLANSKLEKADALQKLERSWQSKLNEANGKHEEELDRIRINLSTEHRNELQNVRAQNQKVVDELGERVNSLNGQMAEQTKKYEAKLKESESARNGRLNDELASLQFALQMKNDEIQKLRGENRELIIQTEKIAEKEAQITKFAKKNEELKEEVNRLKQIERSLISQLNEFRRELEETRTKSKEMQMEREVLEYQLQEQIERGHDSTTPLSTPKMTTKYREFSPHSSRLPYANVRTPEQRQKYTDRPNSSCLPSQGRSIELESDMSKSMDSAMSQSVISCYRQEGRSKSQNTPNKIYTPREFYSYEVNDQLPTSARRIVEFEDCSGGKDDVAAPDTTTLLDSETK